MKNLNQITAIEAANIVNDMSNPFGKELHLEDSISGQIAKSSLTISTYYLTKNHQNILPSGIYSSDLFKLTTLMHSESSLRLFEIREVEKNK
ncbi:hypothetical protein ACJVDH_00290 [Pedobacter sp. AW1-32]|uniref:hypothetical protein n=1 Tax=Pedobacter sp. AW1-32 TaxID=3383026 RepID=UPI003FF03121